MKNILNKIYSTLFPSYRIVSDIQAVLKSVASEQNIIRKNMQQLEAILSQQEQTEEELSNTLKNIQHKQDSLSSQIELIQNTVGPMPGLGKHLNIISNTQHAYHEEVLGYLKGQVDSGNKIFAMLDFCKNILQTNSELNRELTERVISIKEQVEHFNSFKSKIIEISSLIEKQGHQFDEFNRKTSDVSALIEEQTRQFNEFNNKTSDISARIKEQTLQYNEFSKNSLEATTSIGKQVNQYSEAQNCIMALSNEILQHTNILEKKSEGLSEQIEERTRAATRNIIEAKWQITDRLSTLNYPDHLIIQCPLCSHTAKKSEYEIKTACCIFGGGKIERYVCPACDLVFGPLKMLELLPLQLQEEYKQNYTVFKETDTTIYEIDLFYHMHPEKNGIYLNYGAGGWNKTSMELRKAGYQVYDYEPFAPVQRNDWTLTTQDEVKKMQFDGIFSNDLIEHLQFPVKELSFMKTLLKKDGKMHHATGCYEYAFEYTRFHLFFFLGRSLQLLAQKSGLNVELTDRIYPEQSSLRCGIFTVKK